MEIRMKNNMDMNMTTKNMCSDTYSTIIEFVDHMGNIVTLDEMVQAVRFPVAPPDNNIEIQILRDEVNRLTEVLREYARANNILHDIVFLLY